MRVSLRFEILKRDRFTCRYCGRSAPDVDLHVDHVRPRAEGGEDDPSNLVTACEQCNVGKAASLLDAAPNVGALVEEGARRKQEQLAVMAASADAEDEVIERVEDEWAGAFGGFEPPVPPPPRHFIRRMIRRAPLLTLLDCVSLVRRKFQVTGFLMSDDAVQRYWYGCVRKVTRDARGGES